MDVLKNLKDKFQSGETVTVKVNSSNLSIINYDPVSRDLRILFKKGTLYKYYNVDVGIALKLFKAHFSNQSVGKEFRKNVLDKFCFTKYNSDMVKM